MSLNVDGVKLIEGVSNFLVQSYLKQNVDFCSTICGFLTFFASWGSAPSFNQPYVKEWVRLPGKFLRSLETWRASCLGTTMDSHAAKTASFYLSVCHIFLFVCVFARVPHKKVNLGCLTHVTRSVTMSLITANFFFFFAICVQLAEPDTLFSPTDSPTVQIRNEFFYGQEVFSWEINLQTSSSSSSITWHQVILFIFYSVLLFTCSHHHQDTWLIQIEGFFVLFTTENRPINVFLR